MTKMKDKSYQSNTHEVIIPSVCLGLGKPGEEPRQHEAGAQNGEKNPRAQELAGFAWWYTSGGITRSHVG